MGVLQATDVQYLFFNITVCAYNCQERDTMKLLCSKCFLLATDITHGVSFCVVIRVDGTGPIPKELGQLTYLEELDLQWNELDGKKETRETPIESTSHSPAETIVHIFHLRNCLC